MIRRMILGMTLVSLTTITEDSAAEDWQTQCEDFSEMAKMTMTRRHQGAEMQDLMRLVDENLPSDLPAHREIAQSIVTRAFERPRYSIEDLQQRSITDFGNEIYLECAQNTRPQYQPSDGS